MLLVLIQLKKMIKRIFSFFLFLLPFFLVTQTELINTFFIILFAASLLFLQLIKPQKLTYSNVYKLSLLFFFSILASLIFSKNILLSFYGEGGEGFIAFLSIFIIFSFARTIKKKDIWNVSKFLIAGTLITILFFLVQRFIGNEIININQLAIISALSLIALIPFTFKKKIFIVLSLFIFMFLVVIDVKIAWFLLVIGTFLIFWKNLIDFNFNLKKTLPLLLVLSIFLFFFFAPISLIEKKTITSIPYNYSLSIAQKSLSESFNNFTFGSGLATYHYQFSLYKNKEINLSNPYFISKEGASMILTFIVTIGSLGVLSLLALLCFFYFYGFKEFFYKKEAIFPVVFCFSLLFFFNPINIFFILLFFIFLGFWDKEEKEIKINEMFIILIMGMIVLGLFNYYNYIKADNYYKKSIEYFTNGETLGKSINEINKSISLFQVSDHYIALSKLYLLSASQYFEERWVTQEKITEQKKLIEENVLKSEKFAKKAIEIDSNNFQSWQKLGLLYENINFLNNEDKTDEIIEAYKKAKLLAPQNYDIYYSLGRVFEESGDMEKAIKEYQKAFELNSNSEDVIKKTVLWKD